jgi:hypothetical protein
MKLTQRTLAILLFVAFLDFAKASPPGGRIYPRANEEATEKLKEGYAAYHQGWYELAIELAVEVYQKYGDVHARWWPSWVKRFYRGNLPDPYDYGAIVGATIEGRAPMTMMVAGVTVGGLLEYSYLGLGYHGVYGKGTHVPSLLKSVEAAKKRGYRPPQLPLKSTWRPLPLKFREEDFFILVPIEEACKVLGLPYRLQFDQKAKKPIGAYVGEYVEKKRPLLVIQEILRRGGANMMAYPAYEEDGIIWVPFYWLAKQAGIRWWEVRDGKIYVAPKQGTK